MGERTEQKMIKKWVLVAAKLMISMLLISILPGVVFGIWYPKFGDKELQGILLAVKIYYGAAILVAVFGFAVAMPTIAVGLAKWSRTKVRQYSCWLFEG